MSTNDIQAFNYSFFREILSVSNYIKDILRRALMQLRQLRWQQLQQRRGQCHDKEPLNMTLFDKYHRTEKFMSLLGEPDVGVRL